jgi:hypothetical protein
LTHGAEAKHPRTRVLSKGKRKGENDVMDEKKMGKCAAKRFPADAKRTFQPAMAAQPALHSSYSQLRNQSLRKKVRCAPRDFAAMVTG